MAKEKPAKATQKAATAKSPSKSNKESPPKTAPKGTLEGWVQDASLEVPVPASAVLNQPGNREMEFSIGLRQQEAESLVRSELRARALIHAGGTVLALAEVSYVNVLPKAEIPPNIASLLYDGLRPRLESLLALAGHTPPLPASLDKVD